MPSQDATPNPASQPLSLAASQRLVHELRIPKPDGTILWAEFQATAANGPGGEKLLRKAQSLAQLGSFVLDLRSGLGTSSHALDEIFGIDCLHVEVLVPPYTRTGRPWVQLTPRRRIGRATKEPALRIAQVNEAVTQLDTVTLARSVQAFDLP